MKILKKLNRSKQTERKLERTGARGPIPKVAGPKVCLYAGAALDRLPELNKLLQKAGIAPVKKSFAMREGCAFWIETKISETKKALDGSLHAKKR